MKVNYPTLALTGVAILLTACATAEEKANMEKAQAEHAEKVAKVKFISPKQTETCEYIEQISVTQDLSILGGQSAMENGAKAKLQQSAPYYKANGIRITDRQLDKGRGGYDKTRLTLYADLYNCEA